MASYSHLKTIGFGRGDGLVQRFFDDHIQGPFFGRYPMRVVDMSKEAVFQLAAQIETDRDISKKQSLAEARVQIANNFAESFYELLFFIKMSTASDETGGSLNRHWRPIVKAILGWRQLLAKGGYQSPCAVSRLMTGDIYDHDEPTFFTKNARQVARFTEDWDVEIVRLYSATTIALATENNLRLVLPSKDKVSGSQAWFLEEFSAAAITASVEFTKIIADDFAAQVTDDACPYVQGGWVGVCTNLFGDLFVDQMVRKHGDWGCSSTIPCENGGYIEEQPGGTNISMEPAYLAGNPVQHSFLDVLFMVTRQIARANSDESGVVAQANLLYKIAEKHYNNRGSNWDAVSLIELIHEECAAEGVLFA